MNKPHRFSIDSIWKVLLSLILFFYGIYYARPILIPIVFSLFLAIILNPLVSFFERKGVPSVLSISITLITVISAIVGGVYYISVQAKNLILDLPDLVEKFNSMLEKVGESLASINGFSPNEQLKLLKQNSDQLVSSGSSFFGDALSVTSDLLTFFSLVPIYVFFMLLYRDGFRKFLRKVDKSEDDNLINMASEVKSMVHNYIVGLSIVISIIAVLNTAGLLILDLKYALFMGVVSAILTIIPYIGIFIGGLLPVFVALLTKDSLIYPIAVVGIMGTVQFLEGNFISPKIIGSKVNVNPLAAIIALIIGAKLWGIIGMILAIPMTGITKIIFSHYEPLKPYALLLESDDSDSSSVSLKSMNIWKRIKKLIGLADK